MKTPMIDKLPRTLIVGTLPYNPNESSRALGTYFSNWPKNKLRMVYSNKAKPCKGQCESFYQIYDLELLKHRINSKHSFGKIYNDADLDEIPASCDYSNLEKGVKKKTPTRYLLRKRIWNKQKWHSEELKQWIKEFEPELLYICFSDDYFILDIGYTIAKEYNIPIVCQISDDYYFLNKETKQTTLKNYFEEYFALFDKVMSTNGFSIYIFDKIANKYNETFKKQGFPVYLASDINVDQSRPIKFEFNYLGKVNLGRDKSLMALGNALGNIDKNYKVNIYTSEVSDKLKELFNKNNCIVHEPVSHDEVKRIMTSGAFNIIASGFDDENIKKSRFSLSTKIADALASKAPIIAIGGKGDGAIDYLSENECAFVIDELPIDIDALKNFICNTETIQKYIEKATFVYNKNHDFIKNNTLFINECAKYNGERNE